MLDVPSLRHTAARLAFATRRHQPRVRLNATHILTCIATAFAVARIAAADAIPPLDFGRRTLANGLEFIWLEDRTTPTVAIQLWYRVGSKDDPAGRSGFAHLFEHMMFKSTKRMPAETLDRLTEDVGGENNAFTSDDMTVYHEVVPSNHLQRLLWAEAERLRSLTVDAQNFTLEREVVKEEYRQRVLAAPYGEFGELIQKLSFAEHPYKRPTIGNIEELDAASLDDVRAFHRTFYRPDNVVLVVVGDFDSEPLQRWVDEYFGALPKPAEPIPRVATKEPPRTAERTVRETSPKPPLPALAVTWLAPAVTSKQAPAFEVLARILAGGESSRLHRTLVYEKQLAQSVDFEADLRTDIGLLTAQLVLASGVPMEKARTALLAEIARIAAEPVAESELAKAKNQLLATKLRDRETSGGKAFALGYAAAILGDPARVNRELDDLQAVTASDVQSAAKDWLTEANRLVIEYLPGAKETKQ